MGEVFDAVADLENSKFFDPEVKTVKRTTSGPIAIGTEFKFYEPVPPFGKLGYTHVRYTDLERNKRIGFVARVGALSPVCAFEFESVAEGTRLTFHGTMNPPILMKLLVPLIRRGAQKTWDQRMKWIKAWMEKQ